MVLYAVRVPVIAVTLKGIFGGWIAENRCNTVGAELSLVYISNYDKVLNVHNDHI